MKQWLANALASFDLTEDAEGYLLGRGMPEARIQDIGIRLWQARRFDPAPDPVFRDKFGRFGERLSGRFATPIYGLRGGLIGFESRAWEGGKRIHQYLLPDANWNPVFLGLTPKAMARIWGGGNVWVTEGVFDMGAMEHVVPEEDVVLATLRAKVSYRHVEFFKRFCKGWVNLCYDNDDVGRRQTFGYVDQKTGKRRWGALESLNRVGVRARDVPYRGGKDPAEIWERSGTEGLRRAFVSGL